MSLVEPKRYKLNTRLARALMNIFIGHVIICWFNNNTGVLNGIDIGTIARTQFGTVQYCCIRNAAAVGGDMCGHMMEITKMVFTVFVHVVIVHAIVQLMRCILSLSNAIEAIQRENVLRLSIHAIAVFIWRNIWIDTVRPAIVCVSCRRCNRCRRCRIRRQYSARLPNVMMTAVMDVMMQMNVIVITIVLVHAVRRQLGIAVRIAAAAATVRTGRIWSHLIVVCVRVIVVIVTVQIDEFAGVLMLVLMAIHGWMNDAGGIVVIAVHWRLVLVHGGGERKCRFVGAADDAPIVADLMWIRLMWLTEHRLIQMMVSGDCGGRLTLLINAMMTIWNRLVGMQLRCGDGRWLVLHHRWNAHR